MSSCAASCCIYFPRASSASATSASSPIGGAPLCCHFAWQHSAQFHPRPNQKLPPLRNRNLFGVAPTVADRWRSSNALPLLKSNSVLHHCWSLLRNETPRPQLETSARFPARAPIFCSAPTSSSRARLRKSTSVISSESQLAATFWPKPRPEQAHNYHVELLYQRRTRRARSVFHRLALPTPVSISNGICSG